MTTGSKGGLFSGQPVDITVHVVREAGGGPGPGTPGNVNDISPGQRTPPRAQQSAKQGDGGWDEILSKSGKNGKGLMGPEAPQKASQDMSGLLALAKKWLPGIAGVTTVAGIVKKSAVLGQTIGMIFEMLGMIVDMILMPFLLPILAIIAPVIGPVMSGIMKLVDFLMPNSQKTLEDAGVPKGVAKVFGAVDKIPIVGNLFSAGVKMGTGLMKEGGLADQMVQSTNSSINGLIKGIGGLFGRASGIAYVPQTMPAILHKGERVITAAQNESGGGGSQLFNNKFDIHVANNVDASLLDARIADRLQTRLGSKYRRS